MIFDKLFGKKKEDENQINELNKIKKVIYSPSPDQNLNNTPQQIFSSNNVVSNNLANNQTNNNLNNAVNKSLQNVQTINQQQIGQTENKPLNVTNLATTPNFNQENQLNNKTFSKDVVHNNVVSQPSQSIDQSLNQNLANVVNQDSKNVSNIFPQTQNQKEEDTHLDLSSLNIEAELEKNLADIEKQLGSLVEEINQESKKAEKASKQETKKQEKVSNLPTEALILNVKESEEKDKEASKIPKVESKSKETSGKDEEAIFIRLDKYEETLKLIEAIKKKIEENELLLEKIVELKKEEDIKLEKWKEELNKINRELLRIYTTLKNT